MGVTVSKEGPRGCGYRKVGGIYLVCDGPGHPCELLPLELHSCPTCGQGIKPARGWTWINPLEMFKYYRCPKCDPDGLLFSDEKRIMCRFVTVQRAGLVWVGEQFYPTPAYFNREANGMGISRRVQQVPRDFVLGETWVLLAHRKVDFAEKDAKRHAEIAKRRAHLFEIVPDDEFETVRPGVFTAFVPSRIEKIVDDSATETDIRQIEESGMVPVKVERLGETPELL
jgi:hypothetical protein